MDKNRQGREFMKSGFGRLGGWVSDRQKGVARPPLEKPRTEGARIIDLPPPDAGAFRQADLYEAIRGRQSRREFADEAITQAELSILLWATQGVQRVMDDYVTIRTVPSAGARHPFETYLLARNVEGMDGGVYRYLALSHRLEFLFAVDDLADKLTAATLGQRFVGAAPVTFVWACVAYRGEWRYGPEAHKVMLLDAGHIGQNLYLAAEGLGLGCCAVAAYDQRACDALLRLDGQEEFSVYLAPVGRV